MDAKQFQNIILSRYATKKFDGKTIPQKDIEQLFEMIRFAPSSFNLQPFKIQVITNQKLKEQLKPATYNQEQITTCSHLLVFCASTDIDWIIGKTTRAMKNAGSTDDAIKGYENMVRGSLTSKTKEQLLSWASRQIFLALENVLLGAKVLGFDSCPMEGFTPSEYSKILKLPETLVPAVLCTIGYASDTPKQKVRVAKEELFF